ncbi:MAG: NapC/NirT family cytochrome c [Gemmatimonadota bacterium]|nr:NapC/NirT family cytochrome c [Gemmatimonadota bacterium]
MSPAVRRRLSRIARIMIPVSILAIILATVSTVAFIEVSSQPWFCGSCHIMKPYYQSWTKSSHRDVPCIKCHIAPGVKAEAMKKIQAANMVVKYFTGTATTRPWAEMEDAACLRSGCHTDRLISGKVDFKGVQFDHTAHLGQMRNGMQLHCTSCHSQIVQGTHIAVTENTCFLCHFKGRPAGQPIGGCIGCHPSPPVVTSPEGFVVNHPQYVKDRIDCLSCHNTVTQGAGTADQARCVSCHNEPARLAKFNDPAMLHQVHVSQHNVACIQCHTSLDHKIVSLTTNVQLDCNSCHKAVHQDVVRLYAGVGGHGVHQTPSSMYQARVSCVACHNSASKMPGHDTIQVASEAACMACHGIKYANVLPGWESQMERKVRLVQPVVAGAEAAAAQAPLRRRAAADSLLGEARANLEFVSAGKGAHNIVYADQLLRASLDLVRQAVKSAGLPYQVPRVDLGPAVSENGCLQCHLGVEQQKGVFQGRNFDHSAHVLRGGLECSACHTSFAQHGGITLASAASCDNCHHPAVQPAANCARCHAGPGGAPATTVTTRTGDFSHQRHLAANLECKACHTAPVMSAKNLNCDNCHAQHHTTQTACLSCHKGGALAKHKVKDHVLCAECHKTVPAIDRWSRPVCTVCHTDRVNHYPGRACETCHRIPPLGTARTAVPGRGRATTGKSP